jgi:hypothetical protein
MKKYILPASLLFVLFAASCEKTYDCHCRNQGSSSTYVQEIRAKNKDVAYDKCQEFMNEHNELSYPGIDCALDSL